MTQTTNNPLALGAGDLRHSITFLDQTVGTDASGAVASWAPGYPESVTVRCKIDPMRDVEAVRAGLDVTLEYIFVYIRYMAGVLPNMRVLTEYGSTYIIQGISNPLYLNRVLKLLCLAVGDQA